MGRSVSVGPKFSSSLGSGSGSAFRIPHRMEGTDYLPPVSNATRSLFLFLPGWKFLLLGRKVGR
jgi:hypothetical protein